MSIISFTDDGRHQTGKTLSAIAIATYMALEHNLNILLVSTAYKDKVLERAFFEDERKITKNLGIFGPNTNNSYMGNGWEGLATILRANKLTPDIITNYTKVVLKGRLEILKSFSGPELDYKEMCKNFYTILSAANKHYDLVIVDLEEQIGQDNYNKMIENSDIIMYVIQQGLMPIQDFDDFREQNPIFKSPKCLLQIGRYDKFSKYSIKNISKKLRERNQISAVPYNTLFFEACDESNVPDLFMKCRKIDDIEDRNYLFMTEIRKCSENIRYRLQDMQMKR